MNKKRKWLQQPTGPGLWWYSDGMHVWSETVYNRETKPCGLCAMDGGTMKMDTLCSDMGGVWMGPIEKPEPPQANKVSACAEELQHFVKAVQGIPEKAALLLKEADRRFRPTHSLDCTGTDSSVGIGKASSQKSL